MFNSCNPVFRPGKHPLRSFRPDRKLSVMNLPEALIAAAILLIAGAARAATMPPDMADLAAKLLPSVVSVASTEPVLDDPKSDDGNNDQDSPDGNGGAGGQDGDGSAFHPTRASDTTNAVASVLPPPKAEEALGSGFVFDPAGYILTNNHVISGASSVTVTFQDGTILPATIVGRDKDGDLAVLKVDAGHPLPAVQFGDSSKLRVGDWVLAIGNPFGLSGSTSAGIVSALDRNISEDKFDDFIQTDATINRGNSGGPLFDIQGRVIGVNAAIYSPSGGSVGIGFAIPAAMAQPVAESLKQTGQVTRGWLGVAAQEVTPEIASLLGLPDTNGALVGGTSPQSPAEGKLQPGDVLVTLGGDPIKDPRALFVRTAEIPAGQSAKAQFWRNGALQTAVLTITPPPPPLDETEKAPASATPANVAIPSIGATVAASQAGGLTVMAVTANGPASKAGLVVDDMITQISGAPILSTDDLQTALKQLKAAHQPAAILLVTGDLADGSDPGPRWVAVATK
jgi:Do/DeqQ family serine protease